MTRRFAIALGYALGRASARLSALSSKLLVRYDEVPF